MHKIYRSAPAYYEVTKPRIQIMLLFTELCAMMVAHKGLPDFRVTCAALLGLALSSGGAAALNMWYDRDIDAQMERTQKRPLPSGLITPLEVLVFGFLLISLSQIVLFVWVNPLTAVLTLLGAFYYVVIYTMWLKRKTPQNIVIGGGAGAFPPLIGWSAVTGQIGLPAIIMFAVIFMWTPPHFWSLALYRSSDYARAGIPMMPVVHGARATKRQSVLYAICLLLTSSLLYFTHTVSSLYLIIASSVGILFIVFTVLTLFEADTTYVWARRTFAYSLFYLPLLFIFMIVSSAI
ncbi:protoheme IX farnesyltransferase [Sulfoacidibacillus thermotolerans]|uniref:Protoheme IX farnesyltransferase n=1 Tax=Sulfoacidibacillus thermotolerans TaxID=1765684 RepID=A0A2U3DBC5_SULT2|nr:protoheme IX farnesyltransferase [Sulfoacidibacillus thermotolerans]